MIKVVSNFPGYLRYCNCEKCASVIEFQREDCIESKRFGDNGWLELYWYIFCPTCDHQIVVHHGGKFD